MSRQSFGLFGIRSYNTRPIGLGCENVGVTRELGGGYSLANGDWSDG
jgi:hypothetical protein